MLTVKSVDKIYDHALSYSNLKKIVFANEKIKINIVKQFIKFINDQF